MIHNIKPGDSVALQSAINSSQPGEDAPVVALVAKWRERERKLLQRADAAENAGNSVYARASAGQAEIVAQHADELEAVIPHMLPQSFFPTCGCTLSAEDGERVYVCQRHGR